MHKKTKIFAKNGTAENIAWALSLLFDNQEYFPTEIKTVDLPLEYILFFKDRYNRYQKYFIVHKFKKLIHVFSEKLGLPSIP